MRLRKFCGLLLCRLGIHSWMWILPGQLKVTYQGKEWYPTGGLFNDAICERCGKLRPGTVLINESDCITV